MKKIVRGNDMKWLLGYALAGGMIVGWECQKVNLLGS